MAMRLKECRMAAGLSQAQVARALSVNQSVVYRWESGEHEPAAGKLPQLAELFRCSIDDLFVKDAADAAS